MRQQIVKTGIGTAALLSLVSLLPGCVTSSSTSSDSHTSYSGVINRKTPSSVRVSGTAGKISGVEYHYEKVSARLVAKKSPVIGEMGGSAGLGTIGRNTMDGYTQKDIEGKIRLGVDVLGKEDNNQVFGDTVLAIMGIGGYHVTSRSTTTINEIASPFYGAGVTVMDGPLQFTGEYVASRGTQTGILGLSGGVNSQTITVNGSYDFASTGTLVAARGTFGVDERDLETTVTDGRTSRDVTITQDGTHYQGRVLLIQRMPLEGVALGGAVTYDAQMWNNESNISTLTDDKHSRIDLSAICIVEMGHGVNVVGVYTHDATGHTYGGTLQLGWRH